MVAQAEMPPVPAVAGWGSLPRVAGRDVAGGRGGRVEGAARDAGRPWDV